MDEEQRYLRYVIPGFVVPFVFTVTIALTRPDLLSPLLSLATQSAGAGLVSAFAALLASGLFGFLSAQIYFVLPWSVPDYTSLFKKNPPHCNSFRSCPIWLSECADKWQKAVSRWNKLTESRKQTGRLRRACFMCRGCALRWEMQHLARYIWQTRVAPFEEKLGQHIRLQAARKASVGATSIGVLFGLLPAIVLWRCAPRGGLALTYGRPLWSGYRGRLFECHVPCCYTILWFVLLALLLLVLWLSHSSLRRFLEFAVPAGIKKHCSVFRYPE